MEFIQSAQTAFDPLKPSLFELLSEQQLSSLLPPSLRYVLAVAAQKHPRYLLRVNNAFDELYALVMLLVERHFLRTYGGGFTENFYGLKRERVLQTRGGEVPRAQLGASGDVRATLQLRERDVWKNLLVMVGIPYLKRKLDEGYDVHAAHSAVLGVRSTFDTESITSSTPLLKRILPYYKWFLRHVYPSMNAAYYFSLLAFNLAYLFDGTKYPSPFLWLVGTRMRRLGPADYKAIELMKNTTTQPSSNGRAARPGEATSIFNPRVFSRTLYTQFQSSFQIILPTSIFILKFLEWWHASDFANKLSRKATENIELPPPRGAILPGQQGSHKVEAERPHIQAMDGDVGKLSNPRPPISSTSLLPILTVPLLISTESHLCPICRSPVINATATPTGFVYCYTCIFKWIEGSHERQLTFMENNDNAEGWGNEEGDRQGKWENGNQRCPVTGRRILGGVEGLRRVMV